MAEKGLNFFDEYHVRCEGTSFPSSKRVYDFFLIGRDSKIYISDSIANSQRMPTEINKTCAIYFFLSAIAKLRIFMEKVIPWDKVCCANQLTGFYMRITLELNGLISVCSSLVDSFFIINHIMSANSVEKHCHCTKKEVFH